MLSHVDTSAGANSDRIRGGGGGGGGKGQSNPLWLKFYIKRKTFCVGFNDTTTLDGHFMSSPREREKRDRIVKELKETDRGERKINGREETEEIITFSLYPCLLQG